MPREGERPSESGLAQALVVGCELRGGEGVRAGVGVAVDRSAAQRELGAQREGVATRPVELLLEQDDEARIVAATPQQGDQRRARVVVGRVGAEAVAQGLHGAGFLAAAGVRGRGLGPEARGGGRVLGAQRGVLAECGAIGLATQACVERGERCGDGCQRSAIGERCFEHGRRLLEAIEAIGEQCRELDALRCGRTGGAEPRAPECGELLEALLAFEAGRDEGAGLLVRGIDRERGAERGLGGPGIAVLVARDVRDLEVQGERAGGLAVERESSPSSARRRALVSSSQSAARRRHAVTRDASSATARSSAERARIGSESCVSHSEATRSCSAAASAGSAVAARVASRSARLAKSPRRSSSASTRAAAVPRRTGSDASRSTPR